jgi:Icc-related predicted phosphoesterase
MRIRIARLLPVLLFKRLRYGRLVDVVVAHSPPHGIGDLSDPAHIGFESFLTLMAWLKPRYLLHGHVEPWQTGAGRESLFMNTKVVNVNPVHVLEISPLGAPG